MNSICSKNLKYEDCELAILRSAVDNVEEKTGKEKINSPEIKKIIKIVEEFISNKKLICYGGTAINNILPKKDQFYNKEIEIPDYDFFSMKPLEHAKELADIYFKKGFQEVEAKAGMHYGTYKVFVNFIPVADITLLHKDIFSSIRKDAIKVNKILYTPPDYLRMSMYLELSRPQGDVSRWEKVLKRLSLLNKNYPLISKSCKNIEIQRGMESNNNDDVYEDLKDILIKEQVVFFGGFANSLYTKYMPKHLQKRFEKFPDFDVLSENPEKTAKNIENKLTKLGYDKIKIVMHDNVGEIIAKHYEVLINGETVCFIYEPLACHSYNVFKLNNKTLKIATIDTMLSFYLAFIYSKRPYFDKNRILCMSKYLFIVQQKNRLSQKGLLKRFSINCYGKQPTMETMRAEKAEKYNELKDKRGTREYEEWFLKYTPKNKVKTHKKNKSKKNKTVKKK